MTDRTPPTDTLDQTLAELAEDFDQLRIDAADLGMPAKDLIDDHIIDIGKTLAPLPDDECVPENKVSGCVAQVWLLWDYDGGRLYFRAYSDSGFSKGNIALLLKMYSGRTPQEIVAFDARAALDRLGLPSALTRQRANGLNSMVGRIREAALAVQ